MNTFFSFAFCKAANMFDVMTAGDVIDDWLTKRHQAQRKSINCARNWQQQGN